MEANLWLGVDFQARLAEFERLELEAAEDEEEEEEVDEVFDSQRV